jgi:hypothetical protein
MSLRAQHEREQRARAVAAEAEEKAEQVLFLTLCAHFFHILIRWFPSMA